MSFQSTPNSPSIPVSIRPKGFYEYTASGIILLNSKLQMISQRSATKQSDIELVSALDFVKPEDKSIFERKINEIFQALPRLAFCVSWTTFDAGILQESVDLNPVCKYQPLPWLCFAVTDALCALVLFSTEQTPNDALDLNKLILALNQHQIQFHQPKSAGTSSISFLLNVASLAKSKEGVGLKNARLVHIYNSETLDTEVAFPQERYNRLISPTQDETSIQQWCHPEDWSKMVLALKPANLPRPLTSDTFRFSFIRHRALSGQNVPQNCHYEDPVLKKQFSWYESILVPIGRAVIVCSQITEIPQMTRLPIAIALPVASEKPLSIVTNSKYPAIMPNTRMFPTPLTAAIPLVSPGGRPREQQIYIAQPSATFTSASPRSAIESPKARKSPTKKRLADADEPMSPGEMDAEALKKFLQPKRVRVSSNAKQQVPRECANCGITDSPEWRKGPGGKKTLCNACGLRFIRRMAKLNGSGGNRRASQQEQEASTNSLVSSTADNVEEKQRPADSLSLLVSLATSEQHSV